MARSFNAAQMSLLYASQVKARLLMSVYLDAPAIGTFAVGGSPIGGGQEIYRFCDDPEDMTDGTNTYIGASALASVSDIRSSSPYAAESVTLTVDGARLSQAGLSDPAALFQVITNYLLPNRRIDLAWGLSYPESNTFLIVLPIYAGKINNVKIMDPQISLSDLTSGGSGPTPQSKLVITLDSLAARYQYNSNRLRSQQDQLEIDPTDNFFAYVGDTVANQHNLYWGKKAPVGSQSGFGGRPPGWVGGGGTGGGGNTWGDLGGGLWGRGGRGIGPVVGIF